MTRVCLAATATIAAVLLGAGLAARQPQAQRPLLAEEVFKNVPILRGMPVDEFMDTMGMFSAATGLNCTDCHTTNSLDDWANFAADTPVKQTARRMILMVAALNKTSFGGERKVTCFTCHRGGSRPATIPELAIQYAAPPENPNDIEIAGADIPGLPSAAQVLDTYIKAIGGAQRVAGLTSFVAKGTYAGFDTDHVDVALELYAKAPDQRAMVIHAPFGDKITTYDGREGWMASADRPIPLMALTGGNLHGARAEAVLSFPAQLRQAFAEWHVGIATIDDRDVYVLQGIRPGQLPVNLYFDQESGLLVRMVRWNETAVGRVPTQFDFEDYRDVAGVRMPFRWVSTWTNGQSTIVLKDVQANVPIDAARFARPAPAPPPKVQ